MLDVAFRVSTRVKKRPSFCEAKAGQARWRGSQGGRQVAMLGQVKKKICCRLISKCFFSKKNNLKIVIIWLNVDFFYVLTLILWLFWLTWIFFSLLMLDFYQKCHNQQNFHQPGLKIARPRPARPGGQVGRLGMARQARGPFFHPGINTKLLIFRDNIKNHEKVIFLQKPSNF